MKKFWSACVVAVALFVPAVAQAQNALSSEVRTRALLAVDTATVRATPAAIDARDLERRLFGEKRSSVLLSLYGSLAALNAADVITTRKAIARGGHELNPIMQDAAGNTMVMSGVKVATTAASPHDRSDRQEEPPRRCDYRTRGQRIDGRRRRTQRPPAALTAPRR